MSKGFIYIMTNPALKDMVKIGYASDVETRRKQLSTTALPYEYEVYATYETSGNLEDKKLHKMIDNLNPDLRVTSNSEFFVKKKKKKKKKKQKVRRPPVNFKKCGIPVGARLVFVDDPNVVVTVVDERKVSYKEEITSLSAISDSIKGYSTSGPYMFTYKGKRVSEIAHETQWKDYE